VTGSTSGIGLGIATTLAKEGCSVMLNGFGEKAAIDQTCSSLRQKYQVPVFHHGADMTNPDQIADMMVQAKKLLGGSVNILINNAGIQHVSPVEEFPRQKWDAIIAINLSSVFHTVRAALPDMKQQKWGRIINISSVHGLVASANKSAYVAAKHGVVGFSKSVALETATSGITCNCINPGFVRTPLVEQQIIARAKERGMSQEEAAVDLLKEKQPSQVFVQIQQLADTVVFLCSESASQITGVSLPVDGGWTSQ